MVQEGALTALASVADSSQVLKLTNSKIFLCARVSFFMDNLVSHGICTHRCISRSTMMP